MLPQYLFEEKIPIFFRECQSNKNSKTLIIGITSHGSSGKWFDYYKVLNNYNKAHQLFLSSDLDKYYIKNISANFSISKVLNIIKQIIDEYNITKVITLGNSSGGTGAIVYGFYCSTFIKTSIIAGAPFNTVGGHSWNLSRDICSQIKPIYKDRFFILVDFDFKLDFDNIQPLKNYLMLMNVPNCKHNVMKHFYLSGQLFKLLDQEINPEDNIGNNCKNIEEDEWYIKEKTFSKR